ncbi:MAG: alpha amylase C-terminal domain-containing protein [Anaplasmataceae bacterium]|nr:alpha amylase C-terminal domain-containing protein [Anaplasmataceae bacterium]MBS3903128.1 alpha amylase C-terminal domain-containing protein [Anaplasmataceae bacterium]
MSTVRRHLEHCPGVLHLRHFNSDERRRLSYELKSSKVLVKALEPLTSQKEKVKTLKGHIKKLESTLEASSSQYLSIEEIQLSLLKIEIIQQQCLIANNKRSLLATIDTLPRKVQKILEDMVFASLPNPRTYSHVKSSESLQSNPYLIVTLKQGDRTLLSRLEEIVSAQFPASPQLDLHHYLGAHLDDSGATFRVFAPHAKSVHLKLTYDGTRPSALQPMVKVPETGVWEIHVEGIQEGQTYRFSIHGADGKTRLKADPFAFESVEKRKDEFRHESIVRNTQSYRWTDQAWLQQRRQTPQKLPNILELHVAAWLTDHKGSPPTYQELAHELVSYCQGMHYSHVELLGLLSHPCQGSMGYQATNFFAPNFRLGTLNDCKEFIDILHKGGIGVILDFPSAYFAVDPFCLERFDGTRLFEKHYPMYADPKASLHPLWKTHEFKYDSSWVRHFVSSCISYWTHELHIDGVRFDAVGNSLSKEYARRWGQYLPNHDGGHTDPHAEEFFRSMNSAIHARDPSILLIAENSVHAPKLKKSKKEGGLEFDLDWNFTRQADLLNFFHLPFDKRSKEWYRIVNAIKIDSHSSLTVSSHDEFSHGKHSLLDKMRGTLSQKFAHCRLYHSMLYSVPGRGVLTCFGTEFAQPREWTEGFLHPELGIPSIQWNAVKIKEHQGVQSLVQDLGALYLSEPSFQSSSAVQYLDASDTKNQVVRYVRHAPEGKRLLFVHNFSTRSLSNYRIPTQGQPVVTAKEIFNSDNISYGGTGILNPLISTKPKEVALTLPPLSTLIIELNS